MTVVHRSNKDTAVLCFTAVILLGLVLSAFVRGLTMPVIVLQVGFVFLHGAQRYGWRAIGVFIVAGLVISNALATTPCFLGADPAESALLGGSLRPLPSGCSGKYGVRRVARPRSDRQAGRTA